MGSNHEKNGGRTSRDTLPVSQNTYFVSDFRNLNCSSTTEVVGIFLEKFSFVLYKLTLLHVMKVRCRQNEKAVKNFKDKKY